MGVELGIMFQGWDSLTQGHDTNVSRESLLIFSELLKWDAE
jgi:hypothetical protein